MHQITIYDGADDTQGTVIHTPYADGHKVSSGKLDLVSEGVSSFEFSINPDNPAWNNLRPLRTLIEVLDVKRNKEIFSGRVLQPVQTMTSDGLFSIKFQCESKLAYLQDSTQRHGEYNNMTVKDFLQVIINRHNQQVEPYKRFEVGNVTVTTSTDNIYRFLGYEKTFDAIKDKLTDRLGGHIRLREADGVSYIDYLETVGEVKNTPIQLRTNLKDMQKEIDPTDVITRLVPLGSRLEAPEGETSVSEPRLTIESVNGGVDYLDDTALIAEFGIIEGNVTWDDVNTASILKTRGEDFLLNQRAARVSYEVTPVNLSLIDTRFEEFEVDNWYPIENPVLAISEPLQVIGKTIDIYNPELSKLQIGEKYKTLSDYQAQANRQMMNVQLLEERVTSLGAENIKLSQSLDDAQASVTQLKTALEYNDDTGISLALNDIDQKLTTLEGDINSIGLATQTSDGLMSSIDKTKLDGLESYEVATELSDGLMAAADKAKLNTLEVYSVATETTDGLMASTDKVALDKVVTDAGDTTLLTTVEKTTLVLAINELVSRIETLEGGAV